MEDKKGQEKCEFCKIYWEQLLNGGNLVDHLSPKRKEAIIKYFNIDIDDRDKEAPYADVVGYCRGLGLCNKHLATIKRDNKYRLSKGVNIPTNLELLRKPQDSDI